MYTIMSETIFYCTSLNVHFYIPHYSSAEWKLAYDFKSYYDLQNDLGGPSLNSLAEKFKTDKSVFDKYYRMNGVLYDPSESCRGECMYVQYCAITQLQYEKYDTCIKDFITGGATSATYMSLLQLVMLVFLIKQFGGYLSS